MIAYWFRFIDDDGKPTGHIGLAVGQDQDDVYWQIDEFGDPGRVQIQTAKLGGMCWKEKPIPEGEDEAFDREEHEVGEMAPDPFDDKKWKTPRWAKSEQAMLEAFARIHNFSDA